MRQLGNSDGFEGNPQSFRIVTNLALRRRNFHGLNLTRATLNAILKYPWLRSRDGGLREHKWGAYSSESEEFHWARALTSGDAKSAEAELMDWADDIAYSVHDLDDFYRAGLIPLDRLLNDTDERDRFLEKMVNRQGADSQSWDSSDLESIFDYLLDLIRPYQPLSRPYSGIREQRAALRSLTALLIRRYVTDAIHLRQPDESNPRCMSITPEFRTEIEILKQLTREYVINAPALATQQYGQRRLIADLFEILADAARKSDFGVFSPRFSEHLQDTLRAEGRKASDREITRVAADYISGMTEREAIELHQRMTGASLGSVLDPFSP